MLPEYFSSGYARTHAKMVGAFSVEKSMASLTLKNITKIYPHSDDTKKKAKKGEQPEKKVNLKITEEGVIAVQEFNLDIADKEFIVLVGPSGCGKSTTLRMVAGLEEISGGDLFIGDKRVNDVAPKDRDIAMVFQNYALYPHMTVYDNIAFALKLRKMPKDEIDKKVKEAPYNVQTTMGTRVFRAILNTPLRKGCISSSPVIRPSGKTAMDASSSLSILMHCRMVFRASRSFSRLISWQRSCLSTDPTKNILSASRLAIKATPFLGKLRKMNAGSTLCRWLHTSRNLPDLGVCSKPFLWTRTIKIGMAA